MTKQINVNDKKAKGFSTSGIIITVVLIIFGILSLAMVASGSSELASRYKETVNETSFSSDLSCTSWDNAPKSFQSDIERAASKAGVHPALLGAIFLSEHGDKWATAGADGVWARGGNAKGPFQIENWPGFWKNVTSFGYGIGLGNPESMYDSALATAVSMKIAFNDANIIKAVKNDATQIVDKKYIIYAGMYHNRGKGNALAWARTNYDMNRPPVNNKNPGWVWGAPYPNPGGPGYALRTWQNFESLNDNCVSLASECDEESGNSTKTANCAIANFAIKTALSVKNEKPSSSNMKIKTSSYSRTLSKWGFYSACSHFVAYVMKNSGADRSFPYGTVVGSQFPYVLKSGKYDLLPVSSGLQPGDILVRGSCTGGKCSAGTLKRYGHIEIYIGKNSAFPGKKFISASINNHGPLPEAGASSDMGIIARIKKPSS